MNERYAKQFILPEVGTAGQENINRARVLCVGAGGLGCAVLPYLAGAGIGHITIIDPDRVDRTNLQRQVLFGESSIGHPKVEAAARRLRDLNPTIEIEGIDGALDADNAPALFQRHDLVIDGSDNYATKYLIADASVKFGVPLVYGSATGMEAMVTVFAPGQGPCLRCLFPEAPTGWVPNCAEAGVLGPLVGAAGCMQAAEALQILAGQRAIDDGLVGRLWMLDARDARVRMLAIQRRADCSTCSGPPEAIELRGPPPALTRLSPNQVSDETRLIDVREPDEYAAGHIPGAVNLPLSRLQNGDFTPPPQGPAVIYCETGQRCQLAAPLLRAVGLNPLSVLSSGASGWPGKLQRPA